MTLVKRVVSKGMSKVAKKLPDSQRQRKIEQELTDVNKIKREAAEFVLNLRDGMLACLRGVISAFKSPKMQKKMKKYSKIFLLLCLFVAVVTKLFLLPWHILLDLLSVIVDVPRAAYEALDDVSLAVLALLPTVVMMGLQRFYPGPLESMFFATMGYQDPAYAAQLRAMPKSHSQEMRKKSRRRLWKSGKFSVLFRFLASVPYIKVIAGPLTLISGVTEKFGIKMSLLCVIFTFYGFENEVKRSVSFWTSCRLLGMQALEPFFSRLDLPKDVRKRFLIHNESLVLGCAIPLNLLVDLPYIGPLFVGLTCGAFSTVALILKDRIPSVEPSVPQELQPSDKA